MGQFIKITTKQLMSSGISDDQHDMKALTFPFARYYNSLAHDP